MVVAYDYCEYLISNNNKFNKQFVRRRKLIGGNKKSQHKSSSNFEEPRTHILPGGNKIKDTNLSGTNVNSTGLTTVIDMPAQGVSFQQRIADRCHLSRLDVMIDLHNNTSNVDDLCRLLVVQEIGQTNLPPTGSSLLQYNDTNSPLLYNAGKLYHILHDSVYCLGTNSTYQVHAIRLHLNPVIKNIQFVAGSQTPYSGQCFVYMVSTKATNTCFFTMHTRLWFSDSD